MNLFCVLLINKIINQLSVLTHITILLKVKTIAIMKFKNLLFQVTKFSMRTWSDGEILRSTNSNSIVMDLLLVGETYACDGFEGSTRRRSQIILSQKQYEDRVYQSYRRCTMQYDVPQFVQTHPVYEVRKKTTF